MKSYLVAAVALISCADRATPTTDDGAGGDDLPLGDVQDDKSDGEGTWGSALTCKDIPNLPPLTNPHITVSLDGLSLHLTGDGGYDKVFPIGPGAIDQTEADLEYGESLSYWPILKYGKSDYTINWAASTPCKTWWTDPETGDKSPVFAGLPFMSWSGNFAIHGPIDNYRALNGGNLRRGYVSHGCIRMEAADVLEVYARLHTVKVVPVHVQRAPERRVDGSKVDLAQKWIGAECSADADCNFPGGFCHGNDLSERGFCSAHCTQFCTDKAGAPSTFCVADPYSTTQGMCVAKAVDTDFQCRPYDAFQAKTVGRFKQATVTASACVPASKGWVGDHCFANTDCQFGTTCKGAGNIRPGICSMSCDKICADEPGWDDTFCAGNVPTLAPGGNCVRQCTPSSNGSECAADQACGPLARNGTTVMKNVCMPKVPQNSL